MKYDYLIIGAGPAGLQLGYYLEKVGANFLILEKGSGAANSFKAFPRHRQLISINKVHTGSDDRERNLRWDWNSLLTEEYDFQFGDYTKEYFPNADYLVNYLQDFAIKYISCIRYEREIKRIFKDHEGFQIKTTNGEIYHTKRLICATGLGAAYIPSIPGIEFAESYNHVSINPEEFTNQRVLIIGKGNSGFETADNLISHAATIHIASPELLKFAWKTHFVGNLRAVNNNFLDTYQLKSQNGILDATIEKIEPCLSPKGRGYRVTAIHHRANDTKVEYYYDRIISCTGFRFDTSIFDESCKPELDVKINNRFPCQNQIWESVNIPHLYFAGVLMQQRDYRKSSSGFIHGFRYNIRSLFHILNQRYHNIEWPHTFLESHNLTRQIIETVNRSSALMLQFGFMGDLFVISENELIRYYQAVPVDYIKTGQLTGDLLYLVVTLEYGNRDFDPFYDQRVSEHDPDNADKSTALHPIVRLYKQNKCIAEHHLVENLEAEWSDEQIHVLPLQNFLNRHLMPSLVEAVAV